MAFDLRWGIISTGRIASDFVKVCLSVQSSLKAYSFIWIVLIFGVHPRTSWSTLLRTWGDAT